MAEEATLSPQSTQSLLDRARSATQVRKLESVVEARLSDKNNRALLFAKDSNGQPIISGFLTAYALCFGMVSDSGELEQYTELFTTPYP